MVVLVCVCVCVCVCVWGRGRGISRMAFSSPLLALAILLLTLFLFCNMVSLLYSVNFSLTWPASMLIYWNKRKYLQEKRVQLPEDLLATPTWPPLSYTQKVTIPHNICILYGDTYKDHYIMIVIMIMIMIMIIVVISNS